MKDEKDKAYAALEKENQVLGVRLTLAQAFVHLLHTAYDTLLYHRVNYRELPEFQDDRALEQAAKTDILKGRALIIEWIERLERAIVAAGRRKTFTQIFKKRPDDE